MQEETMQPQSSYLICATPFDGSTFLCEALKSTGIAGYPEEYFGIFEHEAPTLNKARSPEYWNQAYYADSLAYAFTKGTSHNGVFGAKVLWSYFDKFVCNIRRIPMCGEIPIFDLLPTVFPNLHYIWFTGGNKVQQAISLWKATQMCIWDFTGAAERQFVFNFEAIDRFVQQMTEHEMEWLRFFDAFGIQPFIVVYEELVSNYEETMYQLLKFLQLSPSGSMIFTRPPLERQTDIVIDLWCKRYYQIKQKYSFDYLPVRYQEEDHTG